jgi:ribosome-associated protein
MASDRKAADIILLDLSEISSVADYFVICTGRSHIQVEAICDGVAIGLKEREDTAPISVEGLGNSQWAILDYGSVVVHVFQESARQLYDLERLWRDAPRSKYEEGSVEESASEEPCFDGA